MIKLIRIKSIVRSCQHNSWLITKHIKMLILGFILYTRTTYILWSACMIIRWSLDTHLTSLNYQLKWIHFNSNLSNKLLILSYCTLLTAFRSSLLLFFWWKLNLYKCIHFIWQFIDDRYVFQDHSWHFCRSKHVVAYTIRATP